MLVRAALVLTLLLGLSVPVLAAPVPTARDEALRLAPTDCAIVLVVQNLRDHMTALSESPFAAWFPTSAHGKHLLNSDDFKKFTDGATPVLGALGLTPTDLFHDIIGDAVVFAYAPAPAGNPKGERSVILIRPRKPDALAKVLDALNDIQMKSKELKSLIERKSSGEVYFERQKPDGPSDFYCFRDGVFAFSQSEPDIKAVIERDRGAKDKPPVLVERLTKLGVADAAAVVLVNPRALDLELTAKIKNANPDEKGFLTKFAEVWTATDAAALYLSVEKDVELGVSLHFTPEKLPVGLKPWIVGERTPSALWSSVPDNALLALAGRAKVNDIIDVLAALAPMNGKPGVRETLEQTLGPVVGKDKLSLVLEALGPDAVVWAAPPAKGATVPVVVAALKVQTDGPKGAEASKALVQALEYGFQVVRIAYNASHKDQIELKEEKDGDAVIKSLASDGFPAGVRPCFALKSGYLLVSSSPDAIKSFRAPANDAKSGGDVPLARFNAVSARDYLTAHAPQLAKLLAEAGAGDEMALTAQLGVLAAVLEPIDKVELLTRGDANGLKVMLRVKTAKPLKK
ncbi:hypothetical protein J8F10_33360 [Gemmata sp. G18]|uniref:DUF3352 domain-containing protein n=1 Tax=Gemmata palustris TaxID=2822762 RepID=A0ABS5C2D0_9BACT|nr:hypothetical protein [Gemmata palustris]MBP3960141.1 hypothetical protein [Gemmata palustris]